MRITQSMMTRNFLKSLNRNLGNIAKSNERLASGRKFTKISENVSDGSRALRIREQLSDNEQYLVNIRDANGELSSAESNMLSINDILQTVHEKVVKGMTDTTSADGRAIIAKEIDSLKEQVLQFSNAKFADRYLFSGTNNSTSPFSVGSDGRALYNGKPVDQIQQDADGQYFIMEGGVKSPIPQSKDMFIDVGLGIQMSGTKVDPKSAFKTSFSGMDILGVGTETKNGITTSNNLYNLLGDIADALSPNFDRAKLDAYSTKLTKQTDALMLNITDIGTRATFLEKSAERIENDIENLTEMRSKLEAVSDTAESMNMKMFDYSWKATLQIGSRVIPTSLMDFLR
ncbi:flagellar hook-associated protein FlgL [Oscillospiraceae bacterium PP1C4]